LSSREKYFFANLNKFLWSFPYRSQFAFMP